MQIIFFENNKENEFIEKISEDSDTVLSGTKEVTENLNRYVYQNEFYYEELSSLIKDKITGYSYPKEFEHKYQSISYDDLRYVHVKYYDFDGIEHTNGEIIVHKEVALDVVSIFYELYLEKYPFEKIRLVEEYQASDELSMEDNNTSSFNYRLV